MNGEHILLDSKYSYDSKESEDDDDDNDSLGSALNDYNGVFYDAPIIEIPLIDESCKNSFSSFSNNDSDIVISNNEQISDKEFIDDNEETQLIIEEEINNNNNEKNKKKKIENDIHLIDKTVDCNSNSLNLNDDDDDDDNDAELSLKNSADLNVDCELGNDLASNTDLEFENYLNEPESNQSEMNESNEVDCKDLKSAKLEKLDKFEFSHENIESLKEMAIGKHGFINKKFRRKAWPLLILNKQNYSNYCEYFGSDDSGEINKKTTQISKWNQITQNQIKNHKYFNQVTLDVVRTLKRFPPEISENLRQKLQKELIDLICKILIRHDNLHYYQGYHDICLTFLLVTGTEKSLPLLESITLSHLKIFMEPTMESTLKLLFNVMPLIDKKNSSVAEHIQKAELGVIFGLSWLITWYSHVMDNLRIILRLYDFFIATHPLMPVYLAAIIVTDKSDEILGIDCDMASLHTVITKYPTSINDLEMIEQYILKALELFEQYPPESLPNLNEKWLEKCQIIEREMRERQEKEEEMSRLRQRNKKKTKNGNSNNNNNSHEYSDDDLDDENRKFNKRNKSLANRNQLKAISKLNSKQLANKLIVGLTFTFGVAAVAMYAMNTTTREPQDFLSKVFSLLTYKDF